MMAGLLHVSSATASAHADPGYILACWYESGTLPLCHGPVTRRHHL